MERVVTNIKLGSEVRDIISGVVGIAASSVEQFNGNIQFAVQPKSEDGKAMPEAYYIDHQSLEVVGGGVSDKCVEPKATDIKVGAFVADIASSFSGMAVKKITCLNGCVLFSVVPRSRSTQLINEVPPESMIAAERLKVTSEGQSVKREVAIKSTEPTGGPSVRIATLRAKRP